MVHVDTRVDTRSPSDPWDAAAVRERLEAIMGSPPDAGPIEMIVVRPSTEQRAVIARGTIEPGRGLVGDSWSSRPHPKAEAELTLMNARCIASLAGTTQRWALAGDQLYVDLDLSVANLPAGIQLRAGSALLEVSAKPHTGCSKFSRRFGAAALGFVNSEEGRALRLRGMNVRVIEGGQVGTGDLVTKVPAPA